MTLGAMEHLWHMLTHFDLARMPDVLRKPFGYCMEPLKVGTA
jgi:hypothetical protein